MKNQENVNEDRFFDLAMKAIARQSSAVEKVELEALIAAKPELQAELDRLEAEARLAKEVLPILAATEASAGELPAYARGRLQTKVRQTLAKNHPPDQPARDAEKHEFMRWWQWLGLATAAACVTVVFLNWSDPPARYVRAVKHSKPIIQVAMLDSPGQMRGVTLGGAFTGLTDAEIAATSKELLLQTNVAFFSDRKDLNRWLELWPNDKEAPVVKIWYDRDAHEVRVQRRRNNIVEFERAFPVEKERDLPSVLNELLRRL